MNRHFSPCLVLIALACCTCGAPLAAARDSAVARRARARGQVETDWPILKQYDRQHLARFALPLCGIGSGTV